MKGLPESIDTICFRRRNYSLERYFPLPRCYIRQYSAAHQKMDLRFAVLVLLLGGTLSFPTGDKTTNDEIPSKLQVDLQGLEARFEPVDQEDKVSEISGDNEDPIIGADVYAVEIESPVEGGDKESDLDPDEDANTQLIKVVGYETPHSRQKRSISTIFRIGRTGYNALRGWLAQRRMLSRVQSNRLRNNVREHFTKGNYDDAVKRYQDLGGKMKPFKNYACDSIKMYQPTWILNLGIEGSVQYYYPYNIETDNNQIYLDDRPDQLLLDVFNYERSKHRQKRWVALVARGIAALKGTKALNKMLKGTKPGKNKPSKTTKEHHTEGDFNDAVDLHKSLGGDPKAIGGSKAKGFTSKVGDRTFTVRDKSDSGRPTIESFKTDTKKGKDRITDKVRFNEKKDTGSNSGGSSNSGGGGSKSSDSSGGGGGWWGKRRKRAALVDIY